MRHLTYDGTAAGRAPREKRIAGGGAMLETVAAEFAGRTAGSIKMQRHGGRSVAGGCNGFEVKQGERLGPGMSGSRGRTAGSE